MSAVCEWTGHEARALRRALRLSVRAFAEHLGVAARTVAKWEALAGDTAPRPDTQAILDTALGQADTEAKLRFNLLLIDTTGSPRRDQYPRYSREWDYDTWADDLDRATGCLASQQFSFAVSLTNRWLHRFNPNSLDKRGLDLHARSLVILGDLERDQGIISARRAYGKALHIFRHLDKPRRVAQLELSLAVLDEMSGRLQSAAKRYDNLAKDDRLSERDRARALLWVGTSLSKQGDNEHAISSMMTATRSFEDLDEPEDWTVAHQKIALAYRGAGDLHKAQHYIAVALKHRSNESPLQRVRLDTAHAHILLCDHATHSSGFALLTDAAILSRQYGLAHQLQSVENIIRTQVNTAG